MARLAVFVDHDIVVRHFVLSGVLAPLWQEHEVIFVFPENHRRVQIDLSQLPVPRYRTVPVSVERAHLYRRLYHATLLKNIRGGADHKVLMRLWRHLLGREAFVKSWVCSWPGTYSFYRWRMLGEIGENHALNQLLAEERPDVIIHPTVLEGLFVSDLIRWGKKHRMPTIFVMNSWDNPSTKAMMVGHPDRLVVWGEQTRKDAVQHMRTPVESVVCLGAAQFDLYRRPSKIPVAEYRQKLGVLEGTRVLMYAGSSKGLNESRHLLMLELAIEEGVLENCFVVYRPHPWRAYPEDEADFFSMTWKHVVLDPSMEACYRLSRTGQRIHIELADYEDTHVTLSAVDAVISPLSTILLEAALHGKPVAAYLPDEDMTQNNFIFTVANMSHFKDFFDRVECIKCESSVRFIDDCKRLLGMTEEPGIGARLKNQCAYFVEPSDRPYAERLGEVIGMLLRVQKSRRVSGG